MAPTALGDAVNLASRTESLSKRYGARILITEFTKEKMGEQVHQVCTLRQVDNVQVKGKSKPCKLYEVIEGDRSLIFILDLQLRVREREREIVNQRVTLFLLQN
jgi:class 3 adenylate cyclase